MTTLPETLNRVTEAGEQRWAADAAIIAKLVDLAGQFAVNLLIASLIFVVTVIVARWASSAAKRILGRTRAFQHDATVLNFAGQVVRVVVMIIGLIAVLQRLGVQTTSIIAVLGAASLAVGLALQGTLSNVAAGVMLLILRPYRVGDSVDVGGAGGVVRRLDLFTTELINGNNHKIVIPNSKVLNDVVINITGQKTRRIELKFTVGYGSNLKTAGELLASVAKGHPEVLPTPTVWTGVTALLDSSVEVTLHAWVPVEAWWQTQSDLLQSGKESLDAAGIEIPYPHQVSISHREPEPSA
jgi:small conductance mechanosensitive channel